MVYGLWRALPGDRAVLPPSPAEVAFRKLDASVEASEPHVFAVRFCTVRYRRIHVHRIPPRVRDDREPPLRWDETAIICEVIWVWREAEYFCGGDWTGQIRLILLENFPAPRIDLIRRRHLGSGLRRSFLNWCKPGLMRDWTE